MWKNYRKKVIQPMRPYVLGEDLTGVSVNPQETPIEGGMIAKDDEGARWYVTPEFFQKSYEEVPGEPIEEPANGSQEEKA